MKKTRILIAIEERGRISANIPFEFDKAEDAVAVFNILCSEAEKHEKERNKQNPSWMWRSD